MLVPFTLPTYDTIARNAVHVTHIIFQILMLSGVGPADHLSSVGVPVIADLPGVGSGMKDHPVVDLGYMDKFKDALSYMRPQGFAKTVQFTKALLQYQLTGKGPLATNVCRGAALSRANI